MCGNIRLLRMLNARNTRRLLTFGSRQPSLQSHVELGRYVTMRGFISSLHGQPVLQCHARQGSETSLQFTIACPATDDDNDTTLEANITVWGCNRGSSVLFYIMVDGRLVEFEDFVGHFVPEDLAGPSPEGVSQQTMNLVQVQVERVIAVDVNETKALPKYWYGQMQLWLNWHGKRVIIGDPNMQTGSSCLLRISRVRVLGAAPCRSSKFAPAPVRRILAAVVANNRTLRTDYINRSRNV